jgi:hypothetical protein
MLSQVVANDPVAVQIYSQRFFAQPVKSPVLVKMMAASLNPRDMTNFAQYFDEPLHGPGDNVRYDLLPNIASLGVLGDAPVTGQEVPIKYTSGVVVINQHRLPILWNGRMSQQRAPWSARDAIYVIASNWIKELWGYAALNQAAGNTGQPDVRATGMNPVTAIDSAHIILAGGVANIAALTQTPAARFELGMINQAVALTRALPFPIKPVVVKGIEINGLIFIHTYQARDLRNNYDRGQWGDIFSSLLQGGIATGNPIFVGALGIINNCPIHEDAHVPWGDSTQNLWFNPNAAGGNGALVASPGALGAPGNGTTSVAYGIMVGAQELAVSFGAVDIVDSEPMRVNWYEELLDAGNDLRVTLTMIYGFQRTIFYGQTYAGIGLYSFASPTGA